MRTAIIGASHWHAPRLAASFTQAGCQLLAVSDPNLALLSSLDTFPNIKRYSDHRRLLEEEELEFVIVLGTPLEMPIYLLDVLKVGLPMAVEKPLAINASALEPIAQAVGDHFVAVALVNRFSGIWQTLEQTPVSERHHASFRLLNGFPQRYLRDGVSWVLNPEISGGGALRNLGIHGVDAFFEFVGGESVIVEHAQLSSKIHDCGVEEYALITLSSRSGIIGLIEAGYTYPTLDDGGDYEWRLGTKNLYLCERRVRGQETTHEAHVLDRLPAQLATTELGDRYEVFARDTIHRLKSGKPPRATVHDLYRAMQVIDQAYALARRNA